MRFKLFTIFVGFIMILISCESKTDQNLDPGTHKVVVEEVINTSTYSYLRVSEDNTENWLAITKRSVETGDVLYYSSGLEMKGFKSTELDRTFDSVFFVDNISDIPPVKSSMNIPKSPYSDKKTSLKKEVSISPAEGGVRIAEVYSKRDAYSGERVIVKGEVVKFNSQIMGKNWVHIQDGTNDEDNYDLTITTGDVVKLGDVVIFSGMIVLNKDFGAGYSYEVMMEDAKLLTNN